MILVYYVQKYCPAMKTIFKKVEDWRNSDYIATTGNTRVSFADDTILSHFLSKMKTDCGNRQLIVLYQPATKIDENGVIQEESSQVKAFSSACEENDIIFIDMTADFQKLYEERHILAHGFINTAVGEGHLNKYGHQVIAERLAQVITEEQQ